jgi:replication factor C small subunit
MAKRDNNIWVEKYRPQTLEEYIGNDHIKSKLKEFIESNEIFNLLFYSNAPGTGKTSAGWLLVKNIDCEVLYLNGSDDNNMETVRTKIKGFVSSMSVKKWKIVFIDEFGYFHANSQAALRGIIETYSAHARFILTANELDRIIDPIQSRCQVFHVLPPKKSEIANYVGNVLEKENVTYNPKDLKFIIEKSFPDIRKTLQICQQCTNTDNELILNENNVQEYEYIPKIIEIFKNKSIKKYDSYKEIRQLIADARINDFKPLIEYIYTKLDDITDDPSLQGIIILILQEVQYNDAFAFGKGKEINIIAGILKILGELKS